MRSCWNAVARMLTKARFGRSPIVLFVLSSIFAACGIGLGYLLGCMVLQERAEMVADEFDLRIQSVIKASLHEEYKVLEELKSSPYPFCSDNDLAWMRMQILHADYLNEAARMHDDQMLCSTTLGRLAAGSKRFMPVLILRNQIRVFLNPDPYQRQNLVILGVQKGDGLVLFRPTIQVFFEAAPLHFAISILDEQGQVLRPVFGNLGDPPAWILTQPGRVRWRDAIFATRCEAGFRFCVTASIPVADAMRYGGSGIAVTATFGGILGALIPLLTYCLSSHHRVMAWQLRQAIRDDELQVVYMPVVDLCSRRVIGAEALVRWKDEEGRPVSPDTFVQLAEERGFVNEITKLVVRHVLLEFGGYLKAHPEFCISINATASDFADEEFLLMLTRSLRKAEVAPHSLIIEITESSTARQHVVRDRIRQLREQGFQVHIDDFGTGYSSLAYLHELSVDAIKIDKSFTQAIGTTAVTVTILPQIMAMADALELEVVVEGIETEEQAAYFADLEKPRLAQGWLFGAPVPAHMFTQLYAQQKGLSSQQRG